MKNTTELPAPTSQIFQSIQAALWFILKDWVSDPRWFKAILVNAQIALVGTCLFKAAKAKTDEEQRGVILATIVLSIIASPLAWIHNYLLIFPVLVLMFEQRRHALLLTCFFLSSALPGVLELVSKTWSHRTYSLLMTGLILFFTVLFRPVPAEKSQ